MIGWWIVIAQETPDERDANPDKLSTVLASWESSLGGLDWLDKLAELGKAASCEKEDTQTGILPSPRTFCP